MPRWLPSPPNIVSLAVMALIGANYFGVFADLDWAWQTRTGGLIVEHGTMRLTDQFSYTIDGQLLSDFEWLYEVILWTIWQAFGMGGLKFLRVVLVAAPLVLVARRLQREGVRWHGIALSLLVAIVVLSPAWNLRPLYCTTIGLLLVSGWLHDHCNGRAPLDWRLPVTMLLWANLHPGVITGQGLLLGAVAWEWLNQRLKRNRPLDRGALHRLTVYGLLGAAITFVSPDPFDRLLYPFKPELAHPIMRIFTEMQPTFAFVAKAPYAVGLVYVVAALVFFTVVRRFARYRFWEVALLAGTAVLGNVAFRSLQDWLLVMLALGVPHLKELIAHAARQDWRRPLVRRILRIDAGLKRLVFSPLFRWQPTWPAMTLVALLMLSLVPPVSRSMPLQDSPEWPVAALDHIESAGLTGRFFAPPDYGAYVTWRLGDRARIYTDTRGFFFPPVLLEDSVLIPQLGSDWRRRLERVLDEYRTDYLLLETEAARGTLWREMAKQGARPIYRDENTVLLGAEEVRAAVRKMDDLLAAEH